MSPAVGATASTASAALFPNAYLMPTKVIISPV
jgi:hypothetical protein